MSDSFHYLVMAQHSLFQKELLSMLRDTGLSIGQPKVLDFLLDHDGASQKDIAKGCHIEPGTLTTLLNRMEDSGLVERRMLQGNRRSFFVFLTDHGRAMAERVADAFSALEDLAFQGFSEHERNTFISLFQRIYQNTIQ